MGHSLQMHMAGLPNSLPNHYFMQLPTYFPYPQILANNRPLLSRPQVVSGPIPEAPTK